MEYWFTHGEEDAIGYIFHNEKLGRVIVFNGRLEIGCRFNIHNTEGKEVEGEERAELVDLLTAIVLESIRHA